MGDDDNGTESGTRLVIRDFDPELHHRLKVLAAQTRTSMKEIVTAGAIRECERRELKAASPVWPGGGTAAGTAVLSSDAPSGEVAWEGVGRGGETVRVVDTGELPPEPTASPD